MSSARRRPVLVKRSRAGMPVSATPSPSATTPVIVAGAGNDGTASNSSPAPLMIRLCSRGTPSQLSGGATMTSTPSLKAGEPVWLCPNVSSLTSIIVPASVGIDEMRRSVTESISHTRQPVEALGARDRGAPRVARLVVERGLRIPEQEVVEEGVAHAELARSPAGTTRRTAAPDRRCARIDRPRPRRRTRPPRASAALC